MPGVVPHTYNPRIWEAKARKPRVRQQDPILGKGNAYFIVCPKHRN